MADHPADKHAPDPSDLSIDERTRNHEGYTTATSFRRTGRTNRTSATDFDHSPAFYWTYEDIGTFLFVVVLVNALIRLAVRLHFLNSSDLIAPRLTISS
jgi:hypothetical protein